MTLNLVKPEKFYPCPVKTEMHKLDKADAIILDKAVRDITWSIPALQAALKDNGINIPEKRLYQHRNGKCNCSKN